MRVSDTLIVHVSRMLSRVSRVFRLGAGATWSGEIALLLSPHILSALVSQIKKGVILIAGTNGKTTTALMIKTMLENAGDSVVYNASGANLENGIVSALIQKSDADWGVFEVDENALQEVIKSVKSVKSVKSKVLIVLLNLFRDQLDRYGEVDVIAEKWEKALRRSNATVIANADDPLIAHLGMKTRAAFFGVNDKTKFVKTMEHATDSTFCLCCGARLTYYGIYFSHLGVWRCTKCGEQRPKPDVSGVTSPLPGLYNMYNTMAATAAAKVLGIPADLSHFQAAFGRQEEIGGVKIFLSKNPAGFNQSLRTALELGAKELLFVLNDRIPDGRDVSWIWDVDFEMLADDEYETKQHDERKITVSGDRVYDLALRLKYAGVKADIFENLEQAVRGAQYILPTYSAMLEVRKILTGKKIL